MTKPGFCLFGKGGVILYDVAPLDKHGNKEKIIHTSWLFHNYHVSQSNYPGHSVTLGEDIFLSKREAKEVAFQLQAAEWEFRML